MSEEKQPRRSEGKALPESVATDLESLVPYEVGRVVSRTLVNARGGAYVVFAYDEGQSVVEHISPSDAHVLVIDGKVRFFIEETPVDVERGQLLVLPAKKRHSVVALERFKMVLVIFKDRASGADGQ